jgi:hypothetical protein
MRILSQFCLKTRMDIALPTIKPLQMGLFATMLSKVRARKRMQTQAIANVL